MKRIYSFMVATVALVATAACTQELDNAAPEKIGETVVYTASVDGASTPDAKAALNSAGTKSEWAAGDAITVVAENGSWDFTADKAGEHSDFSNTGDFGDYRPVMAVYPAEYDNHTYVANIAEKTVTAYIPTWQQAQIGTYDANAAVAVAYSETNAFAFKNATALLKFTVATDNVTHVIFHGNNAESITGNVTVTLGQNGVADVKCEETEFTEQQWNEELQKDEDVKVSKYGTWVECYAYHGDNNKYFVKGETYYIAVAPQVFTGGVTAKIRINEGEEIVVKTTSERVETKTNTILDIKELKYVAPSTVETVYLQPGVWNVDGAWFAAHFFNSTGGAEDIKMTDADGVYEVAVPDGMESVIFCRMNPKFEVFSWDDDHVWDKTDNLSIPLEGDTKVYYNVTDWKAGEWSDTPQESTPDQPEVEAKDWGIVGTMTGWSSNISMTLVDGWYVAENVTIKTSDEFKFRVGETWDNLKTYNATTISDNQVYDTVDGQGDGNGMKVAVSAIYSVYLSLDETQMKIIKTSDIPMPSVKNWGVVGSLTGWGSAKDISMTLNGDWYVAQAVEMVAGTTFKFRVDGKWANDGGEELTYAGAVESGTEYKVSAGSSNISVTTGAIYDVYLSRDETKMKVVKVEELEDPAIMAEEGYWYLLPNSNWKSEDAWFAAYFFKQNTDTVKWIKMEKVEETSYYKVKLPDLSLYTHVIFCRMNKDNTTLLDWANKWNQTGDLAIPTNSNNAYSVTEGQWDSGSNGKWSTVTKLN